MAQFYEQLGQKKTRGVRLAVMDMWKPFRNATQAHAPQAAILFDKFHIISHLGEALHKVRKAEYARLSGKDRSFNDGTKIHAAVHQRKPHIGRLEVAQVAAGHQQAAEHGLLAQGVLRATVGLQKPSVSAALLRKLALQPQVAAARTVREIRQNDLSTLGWNCCLLQAREQSVARFRRRLEQKDSRHPAEIVRPARRGISETENSHLHAAKALNWSKITHTLSRKPDFLIGGGRSGRRRFLEQCG